MEKDLVFFRLQSINRMQSPGTMIKKGLYILAAVMSIESFVVARQVEIFVDGVREFSGELGDGVTVVQTAGGVYVGDASGDAAGISTYAPSASEVVSSSQSSMSSSGQGSAPAMGMYTSSQSTGSAEQSATGAYSAPSSSGPASYSGGSSTQYTQQGGNPDVVPLVAPTPGQVNGSSQTASAAGTKPATTPTTGRKSESGKETTKTTTKSSTKKDNGVRSYCVAVGTLAVAVMVAVM